MKPLSSSSMPSSLHDAPDAPLVLIPAAGFGTRVGSPAAKELFLDPSGSPLIAFGLEQARRRGWPVHVITRKEKTELIDYLQDYRQQTGLSLEIQLIEPSREWPDTLLKSEPYWREKNLLCLPDTVFEPTEIWDDLAHSKAELAAATFQPKDFSTWGVFRTASNLNLSQKKSGRIQMCLPDTEGLPAMVWVCEKPQEENLDPMFHQAWGLLCWQKAAGHALLKAQLESGSSHAWHQLEMTYESFKLKSFEDVTRKRLQLDRL